MFRRKKLWLVLIAAITLAAGLFIRTGQRPADLVIINEAEFVTLDPQRMSFSRDMTLAYSIYDALTRWERTPDGIELMPAVAHAWDLSEDGLTYTFHLRDTARWTNSDPVTAHDFVYSWRRAMLPDTAAKYSGFYFFIDGAQDFFNWRQAQLDEYAALPPEQKSAERARETLDAAYEHFHNVVGLRAQDDHTLVVTLEKPLAFFLDLSAFPVLSPVHPPTVEAHTNVNQTTGTIELDYAWLKPGAIVTNGPYTPVSWRFKRSMRLERNPLYHDTHRVLADSVELIPIEDPNTAVMSYMSGAADWISSVRVDYLQELVAMHERAELPDLRGYNAFGTYFWHFNCRPTLSGGRPNPFADAGVRRAFALAVNKQLLVDSVRRTGEVVASTFVPPDSIPGYQSPQGLGYDVDRARQELANAGWVDRDGDGVRENHQGEPFPEVELLFSTGSYHQDIALAMGSMWSETLSVRTRTVARETKVYRQNLKQGDFMLARGGWFGDYGDPTTFVGLYKTGDGNNSPGFSYAPLDAMLDAAAAELDPVKRNDILQEAERVLMEEQLPIIPLWNYRLYFMTRADVDAAGVPIQGGLTNIEAHPRIINYYWNIGKVGQFEHKDREPSPSGRGQGEGSVPLSLWERVGVRGDRRA